MGILPEGWDEVVTIGLDGVTPVGIGESRSWIWMDGCWELGGIIEPDLITPGLDDPCFAFLFPRQLGRFSKSSVLDKLYLLSPTEGQGWDWVSSKVTSSTNPFPLFSFMVAILVKKSVKVWSKQIIKRNFLSKNSHLRVVSSWAKASRDGSSPSP